MNRISRIGFRGALLAIAVLASLVAVAQPAAAAEECTYTFRNNEAPDVKLKKVVDGREITQIVLSSGRTDSVTVSDDEGVVVRRPSDRALLYESSNCEGAGEVIDIGVLPADIGVSCSVTQASPGSESLTVNTELSEAPAGSHYAIKVFNVNDVEDYVFLGSFRTNGQTSLSHDDAITNRTGDWRVTSRVRLADGSKLPRVDCGIISFGGGGVQLPAGVVGNADPADVATSCWAVDKTDIDGNTISDVTILGASTARAIYARTNTSFLGRINATGEDYDSRIDLVRVRGGERDGSYDCARDWTGLVSITTPTEANGISETDIEVLAASNNTVLWRQGARGQAIGNGGAFSYSYWLTNQDNGQSTRVNVDDASDAEVAAVECNGSHVALQTSFFGETSVSLVDMSSGTLIRPPQFLENSTEFGFDCDGRFWYVSRSNTATSILLD